jgi:hypothetical protein
MSFNFGQFLTQLIATGAPTQIIGSVISGLAGNIGATNSTAATVTALLNQLQMVENDPASVAAIVTQVEMTPGVPITITPLLQQLKSPGLNPLLFSEIIVQCEAAVSAATSPNTLQRTLAALGLRLNTTVAPITPVVGA